MNAAIRSSQKRVESLYLLVDESRKQLALMKVRAENSAFLAELQTAFKDLEAILSEEYKRLSGLVRATSRA